jgi:hypothetical protein
VCRPPYPIILPRAMNGSLQDTNSQPRLVPRLRVVALDGAHAISGRLEAFFRYFSGAAVDATPTVSPNFLTGIGGAGYRPILEFQYAHDRGSMMPGGA